MELFVNELSLHGQFHSTGDFRKALKCMLDCKNIAERHRHPFYCIRTIHQRPVDPRTSFQQAVMNIGNININRLVMRWIDKHGPFLPDEQKHDSGEYFEWASQVVTDCSLGEAAFRSTHGNHTAIVSFHPSDFLEHSLHIIWRHSDTTVTLCSIPNFWDVAELERYLTQLQPPPESWSAMLEYVQTECCHLTFLDDLHDSLTSEPFNQTIANTVMERLRVLNQLKTCFNDEGKLTPEGHKILHNYFQGERAWFSDESDSNKQKFKQELTFKKADGEEIFCPYHGKMSHRYFRIHHSWPIRHEEPLYIAYIGPKITKN